MKKIILLGIFIISLCSQAMSEDQNPAVETIKLNLCSDQKLSIKFLCNPDWEMRTDKDLMLVIISKEPLVTLTLSQTQSQINSFEQMTPDILKEMGGYQDGFATESVQINGLDALLVKGSSEKSTATALVDYYVLKDHMLYSILFSVDPKEDVYQYDNLIKEIKESIVFQ